MNKIPIIILNYNSSPDCRKCVSFLKQQQGVELEIIIVDNCSPQEEDREAIQSLCQEQECTFIQAFGNRGYNAGNNIGLRYAAEKGYEYALIANPDMEFPQTDYVRKMVEAMNSHTDTVVVGSDIVNPEGKHQNPQREITYWEELFWMITLLRNHKSKRWFTGESSNTCYCGKVSGCCLLVNMDFIRKIGFFDENVFLYSEESILAKQVQNANKKMLYFADCQAVHYHVKEQKGNPKPRFKALFKSRNYYLKHYGNYCKLKLWLLLCSRFFQSLLYR